MNGFVTVLIAAPLLALVLVALAALHIFWGLGGVWPGRTPGDLARRVVGGPPGMSAPPPWACYAVAALLLLGAWMPLAFIGFFSAPLPPTVILWGLYGMAGVFFLRGVLGYFMERWRPSTVGSPFVRLNRVVYSPLCLLLGLLAFLLVRA